ncbi:MULTISPECIES: CATRA system-associated protein [Streptomyces]|uniref:CATRA system-associated protein n=1 Tax=Streptomyces TaxID=1883 RepID=UPI001C2F5F9A|nr:CATRA system-associated protein [Streptomyces sp. GbtcB7]
MGEERLIGLLESVVVWELPESRWRRVDEALGLLDLALDGRTELLHRAEGMLIMAGPRRVEKGLADVLDTQRPKQVSEPTRELVNRLLRRLGPPSADSEAGGESGGGVSGEPRDDGAA